MNVFEIVTDDFNKFIFLLERNNPVFLLFDLRDDKLVLDLQESDNSVVCIFQLLICKEHISPR